MRISTFGMTTLMMMSRTHGLDILTQCQLLHMVIYVVKTSKPGNFKTKIAVADIGNGAACGKALEM